MWYENLQAIQSKGSQAARPGSLAGLHAARREHEGQFFTPALLVELIWNIVTPAIDRAISMQQGRIALLDSSCGTGRMFWPANPDKHTLAGTDVDAAAIGVLSEAAAQGNFHCDFRVGPLEQHHFSQFSVGLLNPPFGITLCSPALEPCVGVTTWGKYGRDTSALSHIYAIAQALAACQIVVAVVPISTLEVMSNIPVFSTRLRGIVELPAGVFREEGTDVRTALLVFNQKGTPEEIVRCKLKTLRDPLPDFVLTCDTDRVLCRPRIRTGGIADTHPVITREVTGSNVVRVAHNGRKIVLTFACGWTEARTMNAILRARITRSDADDERLPRTARYHGQGMLDLEHYLVQPDPLAAFDAFLAVIRDANATTHVDPGLLNYLRRRIRQDALRRIPMQKTVMTHGRASVSELAIGDSAAAASVQRHFAQPDRWNGAVISPGQKVTITAVQNGAERLYAISAANKEIGRYPSEQIDEHYELDARSKEAGWLQVHTGRWAAFPAQAEQRARVARKLGLDKILSWSFQFSDLVELSLSVRAVCGWKPALGKTRIAYALCKIGGGRHNLIVCESRLIAEMTGQFGEFGVAPQDWQVIRTPADTQSLRSINIISYERLRRTCLTAMGRPTTYARLLRRRLHTVVADEARILRNRRSDQAQALWMLSPKRRYALDGSVLANYAQESLPLLQWAAGDGTSIMPYGQFCAYVAPENVRSMAGARVGIDVFRKRHITLVWSTNQFNEDCKSGARRQIPNIRDIEGFRALLAPHILRRTPHEPDVARHISIPKAVTVQHNIPWDPAHLARYIEIGDDFADWYNDLQRRSGESGKGLNLVTVLARIRAVQEAANVPQKATGRWAPYHALTSKHRAAIDLIEQFTREGRKTILFAHNPATLDCLAAELRNRDIDNVVFHGNIAMKARNASVNGQFKLGAAPVLLASFGIASRGHNWPIASRGIFYDRSWTPDVEEQSGCRMLRAAQTQDVEFHFLGLEGSIDEYQAQLVCAKADAIDAGLDHGDQVLGERDFLHLDTILGRFVEDIGKRWGVERLRAHTLIREGKHGVAA